MLGGTYSAGDVLSVLAQVGTASCLGLNQEQIRVSAQKARLGNNSGAGFDSWYLGSKGGTYSETWASQLPPGHYLLCAYLGNSTVAATAYRALTVSTSSRRSTSAVIALAPSDLVYLDGSGLACYAFPKVFPDDPRVSTPPGLNCFLNGRGRPIDVGLGSGAMYAQGQGGSSTGVQGVSGGAEALLPFSSLACSTKLCAHERHLRAVSGTVLTVPDDDIACIYHDPNELDPAGGPSVACFATSGAPKVNSSHGLDNVVVASRKTAYIKLSFAGTPSFYPPLPVEELFGVSGFFLDHRIAAGITAPADGRISLVYSRQVCSSYATSCRHGLAP